MDGEFSESEIVTPKPHPHDEDKMIEDWIRNPGILYEPPDPSEYME